MKPKICVVITGRNFNEIKNMFKTVEKLNVNLVEFRIDYLKEEINFLKIKNLTSLPLIATNRPVGEGGFSKEPEKERLGLLFKAAEAGFEYVDLELSIKSLGEAVEKVKSLGSKPIISFHDFSSTPSTQKLSEIFSKEFEVGAEICKIITMAKSLEDNLTILKFVFDFSKKGKIVSFCMGKLGVPSRILSPIFGGEYTYAAIQYGKESAEGQLTVENIHKIYDLIGVYFEDKFRNKSLLRYRISD